MKDDVMLVLDCSLRLTGVAVARCGEVLSRESADLGRRQAAELPMKAERVLAAAGMAFADIGLTAVTSGPGYFTGIRVGAAYAAALAYGLGVRLVPVSSLEMLASSHPAFRPGLFRRNRRERSWRSSTRGADSSTRPRSVPGPTPFPWASTGGSPWRRG